MSLTNAYCSLNQLKELVGGISDTNQDAMLELAINSASRQIDGYCGQRFWKDTDASDRRFHTYPSLASLWLDSSDVVGIADGDDVLVAVDADSDGVFETALTGDLDYVLLPLNAAVQTPVQPYTSLSFNLPGTSYVAPAFVYSGAPMVQVTARWGWPAVPSEVEQATLLQAAQLWKSKDAVFGVAAFGEFGPLRVRSAMNPIAEGLVEPYRRVSAVFA